MLAVVVTGAPGAGKTTYLTALSDALVDDQIAHAAIDTDEVSWAYPFPGLRDNGHDLLILGEVVESPEHLAELLEAVGADDRLLVRLLAPYALLCQRIMAREPAGWSGLDHLLEETKRWARLIEALEQADLTVETTRVSPREAAKLIRAERPGELGG